jgi:hypothetical protein
MSTLPATDRGAEFVRHTDPDTSKEAAASVHITEREQDVQICGKKKLPMESKCRVYELVL